MIYFELLNCRFKVDSDDAWGCYNAENQNCNYDGDDDGYHSDDGYHVVDDDDCDDNHIDDDYDDDDDHIDDYHDDVDVDDDDDDDDDDDNHQSVSAVHSTGEALCSLSSHYVHKLL